MNYYFAADVHLGLQVGDRHAREQQFVYWLDEIKKDAAAIFLLGDIFDFWWDYKTVVPRGFVRTLGKLAELADRGIPVYFFPGNHDLWVSDYFSTELGLIVHRHPLEITLENQRFYLAHGDYIDKSKNFLRTLFASKFLQKCFAAIHPRWGLALAHKWSHSNRLSKGIYIPFAGNEEFSVQFAQRYNETHSINQFIFGHRHTPVQWPMGDRAQLTILGEWIEGREYAVFDGKSLRLQKWNDA